MAARIPPSVSIGTRKALSDLGEELARASPSALNEAITVDVAAKFTAGSVVIVISNGQAVVQRSAREVHVDDVSRLLMTMGRLERGPAPTLPAAEAALFDAGGLQDDPVVAAAALEVSKKELDALLTSGSMSSSEAASALGVTVGRIRQRVGRDRTLFGVKVDSDWRIPRFQVEKAPSSASKARWRLVRGLEAVLPALSETSHPLAVARFFTSPHADLVLVEGDAPMTPLQWLAAGHPADDVASLVEEL